MTTKPLAIRTGKVAEYLLDDSGALQADSLNALNALAGKSSDPQPQATIAPGGPVNAAPTAGTIAFTGLNADDPDSIAFVALDDIAAGTVITLDDNEWSGSAFNTGEGTLIVTLTTGVTAGTIVRIESANTATPTISTGTVSRTGNFNVAGATDAIYAYTGTTAAPNFLSAIANEGFTGATTTGLLTNTGLTLGTNAIDLGVVDAGADIGAYNGLRSGQATFAAYASIINNPSNWITQDAGGSQAADLIPPDVPFSATAFTITGAETQTVVFNPLTVTQAEGNAGATLYSFTVTRTGGTTGILDFSGTIAAGSTDGADFTGGIAPTVFSGSIPAGQASAQVTVSVNGDVTIEGDEAFQLTLTSVNNQSAIPASIGAGATATGNITNDDAAGSLAIDNVIHTEGDAGATNYTFTVTRSGGTAGTVGATWTINTPGGPGFADSGDFVGGSIFSGTVSFANGETSKTISIDVQGDDLVETDETFTVDLTLPTGGATIGDPQGLGTITNDDNAGSLAIGDVTLAEGNIGTTAFSFIVTRSGGDDGAVSATWTINLPGGVGGADASDLAAAHPLTGTVAFADGETSKTIIVDVSGDTAFEPDEAFTVTLSAPMGGVAIGDATGAGLIQNDDPAPAGTFNIDDVTHAEGNSGATNYTFTVSRTGGSNGAVAVDYTIPTPGGAGLADGDDFVAGSIFSGTLNFANGVTTQTISIDVEGDTDFEADETFAVNLANATGGATIGDGIGAGTITNDDPNLNPGSISIADASIIEGETGTSILQLTVTRSGGTAAFSVDFATSNGGNPNNASATAGSDYAAQSGTLNFADGQNTATIDIVVNGDDVDELSEEFTVTLSNVTGGATLVDATAIGTITTDDTGPAGPPGVWINEFHYDNSGTDTGEFIEIAGVAGTDLSEYSIVRYNQNGQVYTSPSATETFSGTIPNQGGGYGAVRILYPTDGLQNGANDGFALVRTVAAIPTVIEFLSYEGTVTAVNGPANGTTSTDVGVSEPGSASGTSIGRLGGPTSPFVLISDDSPGQLNAGQLLGPTPTIAVSDVSVNEAAGTMTFTVTRTNVVPGAFTVAYATANGTATAGSDYSAASGVLSFTANQVQALVTVTISDDGAAEFDETLFLNLSNPTGGAVISDNQALGTIVNDDGTPITVSISDVIQAEGTAGTTLFTFNVARSGGTGAFDINFDTANGSATVVGGDYLANSGILNFGVGENIKTISVTVNGDMTPEPVENFFVNLSNATNNVIVTDASGTGTILDGAGTLNFIHDIQGTAYFSPLLTAESISSFNVATAAYVTVQAVVTAIDNDGDRQGFYIQEQVTDWDGNSFTSEGIFVMTRNDSLVGTTVSGVAVGDLVTVSAQVMEYQGFSTNMPITVLANPSAIVVQSTGNSLPILLLDAGHPIPNAIMTRVTPDYTDSADGVGDTFDASLYGLSFWETVEGMLVTIPDMVVADGFVSTSGGRPFLQAYSAVHADADQINSRGGYTIAGDPPFGPPDTADDAEDGTVQGGRHLHDGDVNPDIIELDWTGWADAPPTGLTQNATMGEQLGDVTGIVEFDHTDRKLFVTDMEPGGFVNGGIPVRETTGLGGDGRALTVATFNVENLDPGDGAARFTALANTIATNLNAPDIICIEEMQDNNGATASGGADASTTWQMLVNALNLATGSNYQWVDQEPVAGAEGGEPGGNIRVGFLYNTDRVQLGNLDASATLTERRMYTDRIGDGTRDGGDLIAYSDDMLVGEINTADWTTTRKSLLGEFTFNGNTVYVTANHWPAKGGSGEFWQFNQNIATGDPDNSDWAQRNEVGQDVWAMMNLIQTGNPNAGIVAGGDFNDFYFYQPLTTVTGHTLANGTARVGGARFENLTLTLSEGERYTYTFDGRSQAIDHVIVNSLLGTVATYDVVHINTGYNRNGTGPDASPRLSDHDPALSSFDYRDFSEILVGTAGNDVIEGFGGNDTIYGLLGNDFLDGSVGTDRLEGGGGDDTLVVDNVGDVVIELSGEGRDIIYTSISYEIGAALDVEILAARDQSAISALVLVGSGLGQEIYGNAGANFLEGGGGVDYLIGLGGDDRYVVDGSEDVVIEAGAGGADIVYARGDYTLSAGAAVEILSSVNQGATTPATLIGNAFGQTIYGNAGANFIEGGGGADVLVGLGGDDVYVVDSASDYVAESGGGGTDVVYAKASHALAAGQEVEVLSTVSQAATTAIDLIGNELANQLLGNAGANVLNGGAGGDFLFGFGGADTFAFTTALGGGNVDHVGDFLAVDDTIALDDAVFIGLAPGALNANAFVLGTAAADADDRIIYDQASGQLWFDADGNGAGAAVLFAILDSHPVITAGDFTVI